MKDKIDLLQGQINSNTSVLASQIKDLKLYNKNTQAAPSHREQPEKSSPTRLIH